MCEFISWIEKYNSIYYLTSNELNTKEGRDLIRNTDFLRGDIEFASDLVGHGAIRRFYGFSSFEAVRGENKENRQFWDGNIPKQIKESWNEGYLDGMLRYLSTEDLSYIVKNAPKEFGQWTVKNIDIQRMKTSKNQWSRRYAYGAGKEWDELKKDGNLYNKLLGYVMSKDWRGLGENGEIDVFIEGMGCILSGNSKLAFKMLNNKGNYDEAVKRVEMIKTCAKAKNLFPLIDTKRDAGCDLLIACALSGDWGLLDEDRFKNLFDPSINKLFVWAMNGDLDKPIERPLIK